MIKFKWSDISNYRGELFGLAIISVIILHYLGQFGSVDANRVLAVTAKAYNGAIGSVGVDIFVFLSGYGIYYSLCRKPDLKVFYLKRFQRVAFPYLVLGAVFWIIKDFFILKTSIGQFLYDYSLLSFWISGVQTFWYVAFICLMYAVSPFLYSLTDKGNKYIIVIILSFFISIICYFISFEYFEKVEIALQRIPSFVMGMFFGKISKRETVREVRLDSMPNWAALALLLSAPLKVFAGLHDFPLSRSINAFYGILLIVLYVLIRNELMHGRKNMFFSWLSVVGSYSLELYIVHIAVRNLMGTCGINMGDPFIYLIHIIFIIPVALVFSNLQKVRLFQK